MRRLGLARGRALVAALAVPAVTVATVLVGSTAAAPSSAAPVDGPPQPRPGSPAAEACVDADTSGYTARVRRGAKVPEPPTHAKKYRPDFRNLPDRAYLGHGRVRVPTVFHVITAEEQSWREKLRTFRQVRRQLRVLNDAYSGRTALDQDVADTGGIDTPFRFRQVGMTFTANEEWAVLEDEQEELAMKAALHRGDARWLNVYITRLEGGLLGFAYFPGGFDGPDYLDGVVMLDGTLPGGYAGPYAEGDTLVHETGHWLALEHTFEGGCSEQNDGVEDTPAQAYPHFECPVGIDTCESPGFDPVHNFMDYVVDACMYEFTPGQSQRMSDAWREFRADGEL